MPTYMKADYLNLPANLLFDRLHLYAQFHTL